jgi:hypothetical protein
MIDAPEEHNEKNEKELARMDTKAEATDSRTAPTVSAAPPLVRAKDIVNGIEFFRVGDDEDCQCARCGSSTIWFDCDNCGGEGEIEDDDWQCEGEYYRCDWCKGKGGWHRCGSSKAFCEAHPMPGRENQPVMGCDEE